MERRAGAWLGSDPESGVTDDERSDSEAVPFFRGVAKGFNFFSKVVIYSTLNFTLLMNRHSTATLELKPFPPWRNK